MAIKDEVRLPTPSVKSEESAGPVKSEHPREVYSFEVGNLSGIQSAGPPSVVSSNRGCGLTKVHFYDTFDGSYYIAVLDYLF